MEIICKERQTGKTIKLIKMSAANNIPILVTNENESYLIKQKAKTLGLVIPEPIMYDKSLNLKGKDIYVDNAEWLLQDILKANIKTMTISSNDIQTDYESINFYE